MTRVTFLGKNASRGGSMRVLSYLVEYLAPEGFECTVILPDGGDLLPQFQRNARTCVWRDSGVARRIEAIRGSGHPRPLLGRLAAFLEAHCSRAWMQSTLRDARPDIIVRNYVNDIPLFDNAVLPACPVACCLFMHGFMLQRWGPVRLDRIATGSRYFICEGRNVRDYAEGCMGIAAERIRSVCVGVDLALRDRQLAEERVTRASLGIPPEAAVVGCMGGIVYHKGTDIWLRAAAQVRNALKERPVVFLWIGGSAAEMQLPYGRSVHALVRRLGLESCVRILGDQTEVYPYLALCDVYTQPSREDAFPHAVMEAMAAGIPVASFAQGLAMEPGMAPKYLRRIDSQRPEDLAHAILELLGTPGETRALGLRGRQLIETRYRLVDTVREFGNILRELVERSQGDAS